MNHRPHPSQIPIPQVYAKKGVLITSSKVANRLDNACNVYLIPCIDWLLYLIAMLGKICCFFLVIPTLLKGDIEKEYNSENTITIFPKRQLHTWRFCTIEFRKHHKKLLFSHDDCTPEDSIQFNSENTINNYVHMTIPHLKVPCNSSQFFLKENCTLEGPETP